ncbi:MAG: leucine--tRNA ligase, partial [Fimbriimonadaceae bacterium]
MRDRYEPGEFEEKWRQRWREADLFKTREEEGRPKLYALEFFPYPSGAGLSVGHCRNYVPTDVLARLKYMQGYNVLHPMGFDAFGLPAENEALKHKRHPGPMVEEYGENYRRQMDLVGIGYDWSRCFFSSDPRYYRWTQWIFKLLYRKGLAYHKLAEVNWCPKDKTALANEEVVAGLCERCGTPVERKAIPQWFFKITDYAQRLLDDLDDLDWPEGIKAMQRQWIGRSEGVQFRMEWTLDGDEPKAGAEAAPAIESELDALMAEVQSEGVTEADAESLRKADVFAQRLGSIAGDAMVAENLRSASAEVSRFGEGFEVKRTSAPSFEVYTTRIDTLFGVTFCVVAPEHPLLAEVLKGAHPETAKAVREYQTAAGRLSDATRSDEGREKTGVFSGAYAIHPISGKTVPIWVADYVLMGYGTGAVMAVPGHDQRDFEFATKFDLPIVPVIAPAGENGIQQVEAFHAAGKAFSASDGVLVNSGVFSGRTVAKAQSDLADWFEANELGGRKVVYRMRDWLISRQRFWGCPIPVVYDADGGAELVPDDQLPVMLPDVPHYEPGEDASSPLAGIPEFVNVTTQDGSLGRRETDTLGGFACSSWYFLRFCDPHNEEKPWSPERVAQWMPVDCYVGGAEHAVMHLLYARFWTKVLHDAGLVPVTEPFQKLMNQGQVLGNTPYRNPQGNETLNIGETGVLITPEEAARLPESEVTWRWVRMSKSKGNVVTPDEAVAEYGADALRLHELFVAPFDADVEWKNEGMQGTSRFLSRIFRLVSDSLQESPSETPRTDEEAWLDISERALHQCLKKTTSDIERFAFNTAVAAMMTLLNTLTEQWSNRGGLSQAALDRWRGLLEKLTLMLAPMAPFSADELWETLGREGFTNQQDWPKVDERLAAATTDTNAVQVNGKLRDTIEMDASADNAEMEAA